MLEYENNTHVRKHVQCTARTFGNDYSFDNEHNTTGWLGLGDWLKGLGWARLGLKGLGWVVWVGPGLGCKVWVGWLGLRPTWVKRFGLGGLGWARLGLKCLGWVVWFGPGLG